MKMQGSLFMERGLETQLGQGLALQVWRPKSHPQNLREMLGSVVCVYHPHTGEGETPDSGASLLVQMLELQSWETPTRLLVSLGS